MLRFEWIHDTASAQIARDAWLEVFHLEQGIALEHVVQEAAGDHHYVLLWSDQDLAACGRLTVKAKSIGVISRIVVREAFRAQGLGRQIISQLEEMASQFSLREIQLKPHLHLESFYQKLGYQRLQENIIMLDEFPLLLMGKTL